MTETESKETQTARKEFKFTEVDENGYVTFTVTNVHLLAEPDWLDKFVVLTREYEKNNILLEIHFSADTGVSWKMIPKRAISTKKPVPAPPQEGGTP